MTDSRIDNFVLFDMGQQPLLIEMLPYLQAGGLGIGTALLLGPADDPDPGHHICLDFDQAVVLAQRILEFAARAREANVAALESWASCSCEPTDAAP